MRAHPLCFVRLESLIVDKPLFSSKSDEKVIKVVEYLLQNTPMPRIDIIRSKKCLPKKELRSA